MYYILAHFFVPFVPFLGGLGGSLGCNILIKLKVIVLFFQRGRSYSKIDHFRCGKMISIPLLTPVF